MVFEHVVQVVVPALDDAHRPGFRVVERGLRDRRAVQFNFVDAADVDGHLAIWRDLLHQVAVAIVDELCRLLAGR